MKAIRTMVTLAAIALLFAIAPANAQNLRNIQFKSISAEELKVFIDKRGTGAKIAVVDARTAKEHIDGHIPGAINMPPDKLSLVSGYLPKDRNTLVVFYCRGIG